MAEVQTSSKAVVEALIPQFCFERLLSQDQAGRRICLLGSINSQPAILLAERAAFSTAESHLRSLAQALNSVVNLGANDVYSWFLALASPARSTWQKTSCGELENTVNRAPSRGAEAQPPDLKLNLIYPCTKQHVDKYSTQSLRMVTETPVIYKNRVRPYMQAKREAGRLNWVFNILDGKTEQEDVILREHQISDNSQDEEGFLLLPDLNWDRKTLTSLHLLGLATRRDIWSVRDLCKKHIPWLRRMREKLLQAATKLYAGLEADQIKLYVHYQPTYYHFHVHVVHVMLEAGGTQAVGKALGLEDIIGRLEGMAGCDEEGMDGVSFTYGLGEASELWREVFEPLKTESL